MTGSLEDLNSDIAKAEKARALILQKVRRVRSKWSKIFSGDPASMPLISFDGEPNARHRLWLVSAELVSQAPAANKHPEAALVMDNDMEKVFLDKLNWAVKQSSLTRPGFVFNFKFKNKININKTNNNRKSGKVTCGFDQASRKLPGPGIIGIKRLIWEVVAC